MIYFHDDPANGEVPYPVGPPAIFFDRRVPVVPDDDEIWVLQDGQRGRYFSPEVMGDFLKDRGIERDE